MTEAQYRSACGFAGRWLAAAQPWPHLIGPGIPADRANAVYLVCDWPGQLVYVGSTTCGVRRRLLAHLRDIDRTITWATVWIVPLRAETPEATVRRIEGLIGRALRPTDSRHLPRVR